MNVYFSLLTTGHNVDDEPLSVGIILEDGRMLYGQFTDFSNDKLSDWHRHHITTKFLTKDDLEKIITGIPRIKVSIGPTGYIKPWIDSFMKPMKRIHLIGKASPLQISLIKYLIPDRFIQQETRDSFKITELSGMSAKWTPTPPWEWDKKNRGKDVGYIKNALQGVEYIYDLPEWNALKIAWLTRANYILLKNRSEKTP